MSGRTFQIYTVCVFITACTLIGMLASAGVSSALVYIYLAVFAVLAGWGFAIGDIPTQRWVATYSAITTGAAILAIVLGACIVIGVAIGKPVYMEQIFAWMVSLPSVLRACLVIFLLLFLYSIVGSIYHSQELYESLEPLDDAGEGTELLSIGTESEYTPMNTCINIQVPELVPVYLRTMPLT